MPGTNYTRNITIYINGKQVSNDIKSIRGEMRHLINAQAKMTIGSKEYVKAGQEIKKLDRILANHRNSLRSTSNSIVSTLKNYVAGFLGVTTAISVVTRTISDAIRVNREFESSFSDVLTLLDQAQKQQFGQILERGVIDLMADYGFEIKDINKALFDVISNGVPAGEAIDFLRKNAELAIGGVSTLSATVKGTTKLMNTYGIEAENVGEITSALFAAQVKGATTVELLSDNVGKLASIAAQSNIPLNEMLATFAGLTKQLDGTEESATALRQVIASIIKPTEEAKGIYEELGIKVGQTALQESGLLNKLLEVSAAAEGNQDILSDLIPNIRAFSGISSLSAETIAELERNIADLNDKEKSAALLQEAFNEKMRDGEREAKMMRGEWNKLLIQVGGGESIFRRIGSAIRIELTERIQRAQKAIYALSDGTWVDKLKLAVNSALNVLVRFFNPVLKLIEDITGKRFELKIEIPEEEKQQVVETAQEITTELTEEEKARQAKLEAIREAARNLASKKEREEAKKKAKAAKEEREARLEALLKIEDDYYAALATKEEKEIETIQRKYEKEIEAAMEAKMSKEHIAELELLMNKEINDAILKQNQERHDAELEREFQLQQSLFDLRKQYNMFSLDELMRMELEVLDELYAEGIMSYQEYMDIKAAIEEEFRKKRVEKEEETYAKEIKRAEKYGQAFGSILGDALTDTEKSFKKTMGALVLVILEALKDQVRMAYAEIFVRNVAKYGPKGAAIAAIEVGLIEAAFAGVETAIRSSVSQYKAGKYPVRGANDGKLYNASTIGPVTRSGIQNSGRPALINEQGGEMILTATHSRQLMLRPELYNQVMKLPQRAEGNYPEKPTTIPDQKLQTTLDSILILLNKFDKKGIPAYTLHKQAEDIRKEIEAIEKYASGG